MVQTLGVRRYRDGRILGIFKVLKIELEDWKSKDRTGNVITIAGNDQWEVFAEDTNCRR